MTVLVVIRNLDPNAKKDSRMHVVTLLQTPSSNLQLQTEFVRLARKSLFSNTYFYWRTRVGYLAPTPLLLVIGVPCPSNVSFVTIS